MLSFFLLKFMDFKNFPSISLMLWQLEINSNALWEKSWEYCMNNNYIISSDECNMNLVII